MIFARLLPQMRYIFMPNFSGLAHCNPAPLKYLGISYVRKGDTISGLRHAILCSSQNLWHNFSNYILVTYTVPLFSRSSNLTLYFTNCDPLNIFNILGAYYYYLQYQQISSWDWYGTVCCEALYCEVNCAGEPTESNKPLLNSLHWLI